ncbi:MAG TPA: hypothetical protein VIV11_05270 [Kofleriaceae bacterium]
MRVVVVLLLAACDQTWNLDHVDPPLPFDPDVNCPTDYDLTLFPVAPDSRYRVTGNTFAAWDSSDDCNDDTDGLTHLAVAATDEELAALREALIVKGQVRWWLGAVQPAVGVSMPLDDWLWVNDMQILKTLWAASPQEPDDVDGVEQDHREQFAVIEEARPGLVDIDGAFGNRAVCECDGDSLGDAARAAIAQSRTQ